MTVFKLEGRSLYIDGQLRQIGEDDTIFCPKCHEPILYWQVPFSSCYAGEPMSIEEVDEYETGEVVRPVIREVTLRLDSGWFEMIREAWNSVEDGEVFDIVSVTEVG